MFQEAFFMREIGNCEDGSALPSNGPLTFEGKARSDEGTELHHFTGETACIKDIYIFNNEKNVLCGLNERLIIFPGVTKVRNRRPAPEIKQTPGKKGPIVDFSPKSRRGLMIEIAELENRPEAWQDFTFADDLMEGLSVKDRAREAARVFWRFQRCCERKGIKVDGIWKKEWKPRKSGRLKGEMIPHYHLLFICPGANESAYMDIFKVLAVAWVECSGTGEKDSALAVALHRKSYRTINSRKQAFIYVSKYVEKYDGHFVAQESIGRNWGKIGNPLKAIAQEIEMSLKNMIIFRRLLSKLIRRGSKRSRSFKKLVRTQCSQFFFLVEDKVIDQILAYIAGLQVEACY
jgi:hypothetical protein